MWKKIFIVAAVIAATAPGIAASAATEIQANGAKTIVHTPKTPFAVKHPVLHKIGRWTRRKCQQCLPVVQFTGGVAQTVLVFLKR